MFNLNQFNAKAFLRNYWQKKPLVIRQAMPDFINVISPDELAGLALEADIESRIVIETPDCAPFWQLKNGPFDEAAFSELPASHWTLLVQGVDKIVPEVQALTDYFSFIPAWRFDDVMISFAARHGSVGPHFDHYDVFLYQAMGRREWRLTTKNCHAENYLSDTPLRIMREFDVEETLILEEGDMLYLPPHVGHYGIALSDECMTYSFGYRQYQGQELWDSLADYFSLTQSFSTLYQDPDWSEVNNGGEIPEAAVKMVQAMFLKQLNDTEKLKQWFGTYVTALDREAEALQPLGLSDEECWDEETFIAAITRVDTTINKSPFCRTAYQMNEGRCHLFINGEQWPVEGVSDALVILVASNRSLGVTALFPYLENVADRQFLHALYQRQWLDWVE